MSDLRERVEALEATERYEPAEKHEGFPGGWSKTPMLKREKGNWVRYEDWERMRHSYEAKVQDFAKETLENSRLRALLAPREEEPGLREAVRREIDGLMDNARHDCATNRAVAVDRILALAGRPVESKAEPEEPTCKMCNDTGEITVYEKDSLIALGTAVCPHLRSPLRPAPADALRDRLTEAEDIIDQLRIGFDNETDTIIDCMEAGRLIDLYDAALRGAKEGT